MSDISEAPIEDAADQISAFMSLPEVLQKAALMVVLAARDLPENDTIALPAVLKKVAELDMLSEPSAHFLSMCGHVLTALRLARFNGYPQAGPTEF